MYRYFVFLLLLLQHVNSLPHGAPATVCQSMMPFHSGGIPPQTSASPFAIFPSVIQLAENTPLRVTLGSVAGNQFGGFMMQARLEYSQEPVGRFTEIPILSKTLSCSGTDDTVTHINTTNKGQMDFTWMPPQNFRGRIIFNATVAQNYNQFWVGITSETVQVMRSSDITNPLPSSSTSRRPSSTTPPNFTPPDNNNQGPLVKDPFYNDCAVKKACFGAPDKCVKTQDCKVAVAITVLGDEYIFEMKSPNSKARYVAVGLSDDNLMGDDSVIECTKEGNTINAYMSRNVPGEKYVERLQKPKEGIELRESSSVDGQLYCKVKRDKRTIVSGKPYDLEKTAYNLLVAAGEEPMRFHTIDYLASDEKRFLSDVSEVAGASKLLLRLHGAFMLAAWVGTASVGILLARYYRQTWVGRQMCGKDLWFAWHRFFMVLTWTLTMAAFVIIFVELKAWSKAANPHAILGTITTIICFLQPIGAYFRPHPGTPKRPIFNWLHWLAGNVAHILGIVTIFFAVKLNKAELPEWMDWILVAYVAVHVLVHIILSILGCVSDRAAESRVTSFPMKDLGANGRTSHSFERSADAPKSAARKLILGVYLLLIILFVAALLVIIVLAPIEDTWNKMLKNMSSSS